MAVKNVRIVLINTSHPGNIGAAARAMKTMCLHDLYLVQPALFPHADATARAAGADDILSQARVCASLDEAIADCQLVMGASARSRAISCPVLDPPGCAARIVKEDNHSNIALVFGREHSGLTNEELDRCHYLVQIPANEDFSSLNLAAAVQVMSYELYQAGRELDIEQNSHHKQDNELCSSADMERFYTHLEQTLIATEFLDPQVPRHVMRRLRQLYNRARPDTVEMNVLRGFLTAIQGKITKNKQ